MYKDFTNILKNIVDMDILYYLWWRYQLSNRCSIQTREYKGDRIKKQFDLILQCKLIEICMHPTMKGSYNGQTKVEFNKNYKRVKDIIIKCDGDVDKAIKLATTQANRISDEWKSINRAMAAKQMERVENDIIYESIFEVFFQRAYELGRVSKEDYRNYKLEKLGI
jgi:hypothetical protein